MVPQKNKNLMHTNLRNKRLVWVSFFSDETCEFTLVFALMRRNIKYLITRPDQTNRELLDIQSLACCVNYFYLWLHSIYVGLSWLYEWLVNLLSFYQHKIDHIYFLYGIVWLIQFRQKIGRGVSAKGRIIDAIVKSVRNAVFCTNNVW